MGPRSHIISFRVVILRDEDWGMFGSLMAEALEMDMEDEVEGPSDSG